MASPSDKDTIYIDIDDEITSIIEKVRGSSHKIVALVLPKRATVLQSIVNMKLLKRSADNAGKSLVLITSETGLLPLAGTIGLYTAKNLQSKPEIPTAGADPEALDTLDEPEEVDFDPHKAADKSVGDLAVVAGVPLVASKADDTIETLELDDDTADSKAEAAGAAAGAAAATKAKKVKAPKKDKKLAVPNFEAFRKRLFLIIPIGLAVLVLLFIILSALPKATIAITTDTSDINSNLSPTLSTTTQSADLDKQVLPANLQKVSKSGQQQVPTTGKKNTGDAASGSVSMTATKCGTIGTPPDVPAGTGLSSNGQTYITQVDTTFGNPHISGSCLNFTADNSTAIKAIAPGAAYNQSNTTFKVSGRTDVSASGSASGGTDNIIQVVAQSDIDSATQKINASNADSVKQQLSQQLKTAGFYPVTATFQAGTPNVTSSSQVGDQASTVTVTQTTNFQMFGAKQSDLKALVDNDVKGKIDPSKQSILSEGLDNATWKVNSQNDTTAQLSLSTTATAGPDLKADQLKAQVGGKKAGEIKSIIGNDPGVVSVDVKMSPFWVTSAPKKPSKITITFVKAKQ